jgi:hypothetical protein
MNAANAARRHRQESSVMKSHFGKPRPTGSSVIAASVINLVVALILENANARKAIACYTSITSPNPLINCRCLYCHNPGSAVHTAHTRTLSRIRAELAGEFSLAIR